MDKLLARPDEAAEAIGVSRATVYGLIKRGELRSVRIGDSVRVPVEELQKWVSRKRKQQAGVARERETRRPAARTEALDGGTVPRGRDA